MNFGTLLIFFFGWFTTIANPERKIQAYDKSVFYATLKSGKLNTVNEQIDFLNNADIPEKEAYEGAMLMRKAGLIKLPVERLKFFKKGRIKLETAILKDNDNAEYRFLRLAIEEHAPKIVKYSADIQKDKLVIIKSFKHFPQAVQDAVLDYCKNSKILSPQDFDK